MELPTRLPDLEPLGIKDWEPLGWIHTQSQELNHLAPQDIATQAKIMSANPIWGPNSICLTCSFTPGSISLSAFELTPQGFEWGRKIQDVAANPQGFNPAMASRVQLLLSDRILGSTICPVGRTWNYSVGLTQQFSPTMPYNLEIATPIGFWAEEHRPAPFLNFASMEGGDDSADVENSLE